TLVDEEQGWYFKGGDPIDLADKMDYVLKHPDEVKAKREHARESRNKFDGRIVAKQFENIYKELLERKKEGYFVPGGEKSKRYLKRLQQQSK
ncbi:MAG TPA: glycosyltransferase, partial [Candidatus Ornithospirochaeta stercorigallinarum]|nr:glycosyltransferase [Candidatus Ornithospirochaeta stercorigallinarum]